MKPKIVVGLILGLIAFVILFAINPMTTVSAGQRGVVVEWDAVTGEVLGEGLHWITPIKQDVVKMDVRVQKEETEAGAASKDLQTVHAKIAVNFHVDATKAHLLYQEVGKDYGAKIIDPAVQESVKAATAQYTAEELITKREEVKDTIKNHLATTLATRHVILDDVLITNFDFSAGFNQAIEQKQTAQQDALTSKNKLEQVKYEAEQSVVKAKAEAESIRIQAQAVTQQGGSDYVKLQAIAKWDGKLPTQMIPGSTVPFLDLNK